MKHKLRTFVALLLVLSLCLSVAGCGGGAHAHTYAAGWSSNETEHWHAATCEHSEERQDVGAHTYANGKCTTCNYAHKEHTLGTYSEKTETQHTGTCSVCGKTVTEAHAYENGVCKDCAYEHENHTFSYSEKTEQGHTGICSVCGKTVTEAHTYENGVCKDCAYDHQNHTYGAYEKTESGHSQTCSDCGKVVTEQHEYKNGICTTCEYAHQDHTWGSDYTCTVCGALRPLYTVNEDMTKVYFGEYPQTQVTDENDSGKSLRNSLNMAAGSAPAAGSPGKWTSYDYYIEDVVTEYMWYIDVEYQGSRYRGVYFTRYRELFTMNGFFSHDYQKDNGYETNTVYWFKYEPIEWRVLDQTGSKALLMANVILDSQQYYFSIENRTIEGSTVYPTNYKESDIRAWLNGTFFDTAFDEYTKAIIPATTVDNSVSSMPLNEDFDRAKYACENTQDRVFLLSWEEMKSVAYGFLNDESAYDQARKLQGTDYAKAQGLYVASKGNSRWYLRTPTIWGDANVYCVNYDGTATDSRVTRTDVGVVPVLWMSF